MRRFVLLLVPLAIAAAATDQSPASKSKVAKNTKDKPAQQAQQRGPITIPPDAVQIGPQAYRYKDADGKSWIYRQTPFGISKMEERTGYDAPSTPMQASPAAPSTPSSAKVRAVDKGDSVRFEQETPMGKRVWDRKKTDLSPQEQAWLDEANKNDKSPAKPEK